MNGNKEDFISHYHANGNTLRTKLSGTCSGEAQFPR